MPATVRYYLSRVVKGGNLTGENIIEALLQPTSISKRPYNYTFTQGKAYGDANKPDFIFGRVAKYIPKGAIEVVEPHQHTEIIADIENLIDASSPFVYVPRYSGIAYQHIWNRLQKEQFENRFAELIVEKFGRFFVSCHVEPVTDLRTFAQRLSNLDVIHGINATVRPPNPLFGPCWKSLKEYIKSRNVGEVAVRESAETGGTIRTNISKIASLMLDSPDKNKEEVTHLLEAYDKGIADSAVLMAADGYGKAKIEGTENSKSVVIKTRENQKSFLLSRDPSPEELYEKASAEFEKINEERYLDH